MTTGDLDIGGNDPSGLLRYIRYYYFTLGIDYDTEPEAARPKWFNTQAWRMLRCRYLVL